MEKDTLGAHITFYLKGFLLNNELRLHISVRHWELLSQVQLYKKTAQIFFL